jgi:hypothetical protein
MLTASHKPLELLHIVNWRLTKPYPRLTLIRDRKRHIQCRAWMQFNLQGSVDMKLVLQLIKPAVIIGGLLLVMPVAVMADKPDAGVKGGKPNKNSVAVTAACTVDYDTARVCSCKGLSNVVLWCGTAWVKHENFGSDGDTEEVFDATVDCVDGAGNALPGPITMIAIKSGSQKNAKHHPDGYQTVEGAPSGSGLFTTPEACSSDFVCPAAGDCSGGDEPPGDEPPGDEPPGDEPPGDEDPPVLG